MDLLQYNPPHLKSLLALLSVVKCSFALRFYYAVGILLDTLNQRHFELKKEIFRLVAGEWVDLPASHIGCRKCRWARYPRSTEMLL